MLHGSNSGKVLCYSSSFHKSLRLRFQSIMHVFHKGAELGQMLLLNINAKVHEVCMGVNGCNIAFDFNMITYDHLGNFILLGIVSPSC